IQQEIIKLSEDFSRYQSRWDKLSTHIDTVQKDVKDIHTSTRKITSKFEKIAKVDLEKEGNLKKPLQKKLLEEPDKE
ncbi:MAG: hypothetical protein Q7J65_05515, partial [Candidatus Marinimicrobia bacterium]|nr:hypothetical protein [Candidatus Neomarinimicrobiota bacterium]